MHDYPFLRLVRRVLFSYAHDIRIHPFDELVVFDIKTIFDN